MGQESHRRTEIVGPAEKKEKKTNGSTERVRAQGPTQKPIEKLMRVFSEATYYRWGRQPWLKRDVKVSRKMWCRPEACPSLRWQINLSVSGELLCSSNPPRCVDLSRQGTSCCRCWPWNFRRPPPPPKKLCRSGWVDIFSLSSLTILTQCSLGPAASQSCARRRSARPTPVCSAGAAPRPCSSYSFSPKLLMMTLDGPRGRVCRSRSELGAFSSVHSVVLRCSSPKGLAVFNG